MSKNLRSQSGMSLVEATIILSVLAIVSSVAAPSINDYVQDAKQTKAREDVQAIGSVLTRMLKDTGETMALLSGTVVGSAGPSHASTNRVTMLVSDGDVPAVAGSTPGPSTTDWNSLTTDIAPKIVRTMAGQLILNTPAYRNLAGMSVATNFDPTAGQTVNSEYGWRGPYLSGPVDPDPWGHRYAINAEFLGRISGGAQANFDNDVFVLCVGPDGEADTPFSGTTVSPLDDDIIYMISGAVR